MLEGGIVRFSTMQALKEIQKKLKAPKNQRNNFGGFNYRSCEDILEAVKPLLAENDALLLLGDEVVEIGGRHYVKATARYVHDSECIEVSALAREPEAKKGMDEPQITGTASSYARKYALNGLFLIDDTKDPDTNEYMKVASAASKPAEAATVSARNHVDFKAVREHLTEIETEDELNKYWLSLKLTDKQANVLKGDFSKRKMEIAE